MSLDRCRPWTFAVLVSLALLSAGCKKAEAPPERPATAAKPVTQPAAAAPAPVATPGAPGPGAVVSDPVKADDVTIQATLGDGKSVGWALKQSEVKDDPTGQWASSATASSTYNDAKDPERFSAWQATGTPNVDQASDSGNAWTPKSADGGIEWLQLKFAKPASAAGLRIRESDNGGAVIKIDLLDEQNGTHALWSGSDPTKALNYFMLTFPKTAYKVSGVKITLATNLVAGYNEIDAVQLVGTEK